MSETESSQIPSPAAVRTDILVIDDSIADLRLLMHMMSLNDLHVSVAVDGERGCQLAEQLQPLLVLLDVRMPGIDGLTVCARLKRNPLTRAIPVIFLTAANDLAERLEGFATGAVDYIGKPFAEQEVLARVGVHLQRQMPAASVDEPGVPESSQESDVLVRLVLTAQQLLREKMDDPPTLDQLARQVGTNRRRLNEGFQALCGQPVYGWLREERLRLAHQRVGHGGDTFSEISDSLGYSTPANFAKAFRLRFGCSPSELRSQLQPASVDPMTQQEADA